MPLQDLDLNLLRVFAQLLSDRQVSRAAEHLGLTQPAVSNALRRLRAVLQDELFVRTPHGMAPTTYALQLAEPVTRALELLSGALQPPEPFDPRRSQRTFVLAMTDIGEIYFMPQLMDALGREAPGCTLSTVYEGALEHALQEGAVDLAIGLLPGLQSGFFQRRLFSNRYVCLCRADHPVTRAPLTLDALAAYGHVRVVAGGTGHGAVDAGMRRAGLERQIRLEVPHFVAVGHILQRTDLLATVPERFAQACLVPFGLTALPLPLALPEIDINLFWHARFHRDPANRWLRSLLGRLFADHRLADQSAGA